MDGPAGYDGLSVRARSYCLWKWGQLSIGEFSESADGRRGREGRVLCLQPSRRLLDQRFDLRGDRGPPENGQIERTNAHGGERARR